MNLFPDPLALGHPYTMAQLQRAGPSCHRPIQHSVSHSHPPYKDCPEHRPVSKRADNRDPTAPETRGDRFQSKRE